MSSPSARKPVAMLLLYAAAIAGCSTSVPREDRAVPSTVRVRPAPVPKPVSRPVTRTAPEKAAIAAARQVGVPYRYGGETTSGFDCSGLVKFAYAQAGVRTPRTTGALWRELSPVSTDDLRVGDILFFDIEGKVSHVGLYLGDGRFVHAPSTGREVSIASLSTGYYRSALVRGGRP